MASSYGSLDAKVCHGPPLRLNPLLANADGTAVATAVGALGASLGRPASLWQCAQYLRLMTLPSPDLPPGKGDRDKPASFAEPEGACVRACDRTLAHGVIDLAHRVCVHRCGQPMRAGAP
jgi:hypothetical protein